MEWYMWVWDRESAVWSIPAITRTGHFEYSRASGITQKKDGYRQQNVRQRQKLISIIDYDVCMTFY